MPLGNKFIDSRAGDQQSVETGCNLSGAVVITARGNRVAEGRMLQLDAAMAATVRRGTAGQQLFDAAAYHLTRTRRNAHYCLCALVFVDWRPTRRVPHAGLSVKMEAMNTTPEEPKPEALASA